MIDLSDFEEVKEPTNSNIDLAQFEDAGDDEVAYIPPKARAIATPDLVKSTLFNRGTEGLVEAIDLNEGDLQWPVQTFYGVSPEVAAKTNRIAKEQNIDLNNVVENSQEWIEWDEAQKTYQKLVEKNENGEYKNPTLALRIKDPLYAVMMKDDIEPLSKLERWIHEDRKKDEGMLSQKLSAFQSGIEGVNADFIARFPAVAFSLLSWPGNKLAEITGQPQMPVPEILINNDWTRYHERRQAIVRPVALDKDTMKLFEEGKIGDAVNNLFNQAAESLPYTVAVAASALAGSPGTGLAVAGLSVAGGTLKEAQAEGKTPVQMTENAVLQSGFEMLFESIGTQAILSDVGKQIYKTYGKQTAIDFAKGVGDKIASSSFKEGASEFATTIAQDFSDYITGDPKAMQGTVGRAINSFLVGNLTGGVLVGPSAIIDGARRAEQSKAEFANWEKIEEAAAESKLRQRSPEEFAAFTDSVLDGSGQDKNIYVPIEPIQTFLQSKPEDGKKLIKDLGIEKQVEEANVTGADIEIPKAQWLARYAKTPIAEAFKNDVRLSQSGMSLKEQEAFVESAKNDLKTLEEEFAKLEQENVTPEQITVMREQVMAKLNLKANQADTQLAPLIATLQHFAKDKGETLQAKLQREPTLLNIAEDQKAVKEAFLQKAREGIAEPVKIQKTVEKMELPEEYKNVFLTSYIQDELANMAAELDASTAGSKAFLEAEKGGAPRVIGIPSTFPKWFRDAGFGDKKSALSKIKTGHKDAIAVAIDRLENGWGDDMHGYAYPNLSFLRVVNPEKAREWEERIKAEEDKNKALDEFNDVDIDEFFQSASEKELAPELYFKAEQIATQKMGGSATPQQILGMFKEVKPDEMDTLGIKEFLAGKEKVTKEELLKFLKENRVQVEVVQKADNGGAQAVLGEEVYTVFSPDGEGQATFLDVRNANAYAKEQGEGFTVQGVEWDGETTLEDLPQAEPTKFGQYVLPGGENYREVLFRMPEKVENAREKLAEKMFGKKENELNLSQQTQFVNALVKQTPIAEDKFRSSHWDQTNILFHVRLNDRTDVNGKKVLFVEEIQSDWHQAGRDKGYKGDKMAEDPRLKELEDLKKQYAEIGAKRLSFFEGEKPELIDIEKQLHAFIFAKEGIDTNTVKLGKLEKLEKDLSEKYPEIAPMIARREAVADEMQKLESDKKLVENKIEQLEIELSRAPKNAQVPNAPLKKTWHEQALKRVLRMAAEGGYDSIAWTTGSQQNERYRLAKFINSITYMKQNDGRYWVQAEDKNGKLVYNKRDLMPKEIEDLIGKDMANKILAGEGKEDAVGFKTLADTDLEVGGEGMKGFYDRIVPQFLSKYTKKWGGVVGTTKLSSEIPAESIPISQVKLLGSTVHALDITPQMKEAVLYEGQTFFQDKNAPRGSVQFQDNQTIINLFKNADMSTFLHEGGHVLVNELQKAIKGGYASKRTIESYNILKEFAGGKFDTAGHEKIADAWETYFMEGKAPSLKLLDVFQTFRAWLTAIYRGLKNRAPINDDVRRAFDNILASEQEVAEAKQYYEGKKSFSEALGLNESEELKTLKEDAKQTALDKQVAKYMRAYKKAIGGRKTFISHAEREINNREEYMAIDMAIADGALDMKEVEAIGGKNAVEAMKKHTGAMSEKGKLSIAELLPNFEYASEQELLNAMIRAEKKSEAIKKRADEIEKEQEVLIREELSKEEKIHGEEAIHNEKSLEVILAEGQLLTDKINEGKAPTARDRLRYLERKALKDSAIEFLYKKTYAKASRYDLHAKAEQRAANDAIKFAEEGDLVKAHQAKQKQIFNHILVQESVKIREEIRDMEKRYSAKKISKTLENVEDSFRQYALDILNQYKLSTSENVGPTGTIIDLNDLDPMLASLVPAWIQNREFAGNWKELSVSKVMELNEALQSIVKYGRQELKSLDEAEIKTIEAFVTASTDRMNKLEDKQVYDEFSIKNKIVSKVDAGLSQLVQMEFLFERLDNFEFNRTKEFGPLRRLFNAGRKNEAKFQDLKTDVYDKAKPHLTTLWNAVKRIETQMGGKSFDIPGVPTTESMKDLGRFGWTAERIIAFTLNMGNAGNLDSLRNSYQYTDAQMLKVAGMLTKEELQAVQGLWNVTDILFPELDKTHFEIYNAHLAKVDRSPITINGVELEGGYYPMVFDQALSDRAAEQAEQKALDEDIMRNQSKAVFRKTKPEDGFTKERTGNALPVKLELNVWFSHINATARYIAYAEYMRDLNRVTLNKEFRKTFYKKAGRELYQALRQWVQNLAVPERSAASGFEKFFDYQRKMGSIAILGFNLTSAIKQQLALFNVAQEIGWKWIAEGYRGSTLKSLLGFESSDKWQEIVKMSPYLRSRQGNIDRELSDALDKMSPRVNRFEIAGQTFTWKDVQAWAFEMMTMSDRSAIGVAWQGAFNKYFQENLSKDMTDKQRMDDAIAKADSVISTTQPSSLAFDMSLLQKSEGAIRLFTSFMTGTLKAGNRFLAKNQAYRSGAISAKDYYRHLLYEMFFFGWGDALIGGIMAAGAPPELWALMLAPFEQLIAWIPFARDLAGAIKYRKSIGATPATEGLDRAVKAIVSTAQGVNGEKEWAKVMYDVGKALEFQVGVPAFRLMRDADKNYKNITGQNERNN